jgi:hypothetical protein
MNERTKKVFNKLVLEQYADGYAHGIKIGERVKISLATYRGLCESALEVKGTEDGCKAFYQVLKNIGVCRDWVNAPIDILEDRQFEIMYAEQNGWTDR